MIYINILKSYFSFIIIFSIIIIVFFYPILSSNALTTSNISSNSDFEHIDSSLKISKSTNGSFIWPVPGNTKISSPFGKRNSPTKFASSFHKGIDIPASPGTNIFAIMSGTVVMAKFNGGGGCTVTIQNGNLFTSYCHVSPNFIVCPGQYVSQGDLIAQVGPKNVYGFADNKYYDSNGNPTNGATTGPHLHLAVRENNEYKNPLDFINY